MSRLYSFRDSTRLDRLEPVLGPWKTLAAMAFVLVVLSSLGCGIGEVQLPTYDGVVPESGIYVGQRVDTDSIINLPDSVVSTTVWNYRVQLRVDDDGGIKGRTFRDWEVTGTRPLKKTDETLFTATLVWDSLIGAVENSEYPSSFVWQVDPSGKKIYVNGPAETQSYKSNTVTKEGALTLVLEK